ncbi:MAG: DUF3891 family protein [Candidatus Dadabacteria bacterium]|nr:DUF3891 family protein [Candidatus Dadabacteria bacterium]
MIRRKDSEEWILVPQHDHAVLAGEIIALWGNDVFTRPRPFGEVVFAVAEHDSGWKEWDSRPKINPENGYPANFMEMESGDQYRIWKGSYLGHAREHPYASSLIALHFDRFNEKSLSKNPGNGKAKLLEREIREFVSANAGVEITPDDLSALPQEVRINLRFVQVGDIVSLTLCHGWESMEIKDVPVDYDGNAALVKITSPDGFNFTMDPYPFTEPLIKCGVPALRLARASFESDDDLRRALRDARPLALDFTIGKG